MKQKLITIILTLIAILSPLLIIPKTINDNYNILKLWTLLIGGLLLVVLLLASYKDLVIDKKDIIILIFLGLVFLSTLVSSNIKKSIIGEKNRYEGLLMFITYTCIYLSAKKYFKYEKIYTFLNIMFYVSIIIGILGIAQKYVKCEALYPIFNKGICATFGNSNFFGSFISIILPISISIFIFKGNKKGFILSLVMFFNMISSGTRSAWVAFAVVGIIGTAYLLKSKNKTYFKRFIILLLCFILIFGYLFNGFGLIKTNSVTKIKFNQMKNDIKNTTSSGLENNMGSGRIEIWKMTLKLIKQKPILGCGIDNLKEGLRTYCEEDFYQFIIRTHTVPDKAHNEYIQIAATIGVPALTIYIIFISMILLNKMKNMLNNKLSFIITITIISYLVQAFFNISTIGVAPIFWIILGLSNNEDFINNNQLKKYNKNG